MEENNTTIVVEEYLLMISSLQQTSDSIKSVLLAQKMKNSPSTVHATLSRMQRDGLIKMNKKKEIILTEKGKKQVYTLERRHHLVERFLCDTLKIPWYEIHKHAHKLEHAITPLVEEKLDKFLNYPKFCPHGSPVPGSDFVIPENLFQLLDAKQGEKIQIFSIAEILEESEDLLKFLHDREVIPGKIHQVFENTDITSTIVLEKDGNYATIPYDVADKIGVIPFEQKIQ